LLANEAYPFIMTGFDANNCHEPKLSHMMA
jgi:hypothetical protein